MASPLVPFQANVQTPDGSPYLLQMSQGFNQAVWYGSGLPQTPELATRIENLMAAVNGQVGLPDPGEIFLSHLMALSWHIEWLVNMLMGSNVTLDNHQAFIDSLSNLGSELYQLDKHPVLGEWIKTRLQDAQFRHFERFGLNPVQPLLAAGPVTRPQRSSWNSAPHEHAFLRADDFLPLAP